MIGNLPQQHIFIKIKEGDEGVERPIFYQVTYLTFHETLFRETIAFAIAPKSFITRRKKWTPLKITDEHYSLTMERVKKYFEDLAQKKGIRSSFRLNNVFVSIPNQSHPFRNIISNIFASGALKEGRCNYQRNFEATYALMQFLPYDFDTISTNILGLQQLINREKDNDQFFDTLDLDDEHPKKVYDFIETTTAEFSSVFF